MAPNPSPSATERAPTALDDLVLFVDAAQAADARLREAVPSVNRAVHAREVVVDAETSAAVRAADPAEVATLIPAGMPDPLVQATVLVYSDLASRYAAMRAFGGDSPRSYPRFPPEVEQGLADLAEGESMVLCLANGSPAAARFDDDLDALVALATATPPLAPVAASSLAAAEVTLRTTLVDLGNNGCASCGGYVATTSEPITWDEAPAGATTRTGTVAGVDFQVTYQPGSGWTAQLNAC